MCKIQILFVLLFSLANFSFAHAVSAKSASVSIVSLIAVPEKFDKQIVKTTGWYFADSKSAEPLALLFLSEPDISLLNIQNALIVEMSRERIKHYLDLQNKPVEIEGLFKKERGIGFASTNPSLNSIVSIKELKRPGPRETDRKDK